MIGTTSSGISNQVREIYARYEIAAGVLLHLYRKLLFCFNVVFSRQILLTDKIDNHSIIFYEIYVNHPWLTYTFCTIIVFTFYVPCSDVRCDFA